MIVQHSSRCEVENVAGKRAGLDRGMVAFPIPLGNTGECYLLVDRYLFILGVGAFAASFPQLSVL